MNVSRRAKYAEVNNRSLEMNRKGWTWVETVVSMWSGVVVALVIVAEIRSDNNRRVAIEQSIESETPVSIVATLRTVEHDGHRFVTITRLYGGAGVIHHPDCPCQSLAEISK